MKNLICLSLFLLVGFAGRSQYNDTLYYKSGFAKPVEVRSYDDHSLVYEYRSKKGKLITARISRLSLKSFVIYNEFNELKFDSKAEARKEEEQAPGNE